MSKNLIVQAAPHIHSSENTSRIMALVLISLAPAAAASIWLFGLRALLLILCCVAGCVGFEYLACRIMKRPNPIGDLSAAVTGLLLALNLPVTMPIPLALIGCFFAVGINLSFTGIPYVNMPEKNQTVFIGFYSTMANFAALIGVTIGKYFILSTEHVNFSFLGMQFGNKQLIVVLTGALMSLAVLGIHAISRKVSSEA